MEGQDTMFWWGVTVVLSGVITRILWNKAKSAKLPPGPKGLPILGSLLELGDRPNESLKRLSDEYGPLMTLKLGMVTTVVASSPEIAKEFLKTSDHVLSGRMVPHADEAVSHYKSSLVFGQVGDYWHMLRRISKESLFSSKKLESFQSLRKIQVDRMVSQIFESCSASETNTGDVDVGKISFSVTVNLMANMIFGTDILDPESKEFEELKGSVRLVTIMLGIPNVADYFPFLKPFDPQGVKRRAKHAFDTMYGTLDKLIQRRLEDKVEGQKDLMDTLLATKKTNGEALTMTDIRAYLADLFNAATDTSTTIIEWAMAELVKNPDILRKAQKELDEVVGKDRKVEEEDMDRLPYLRAIVRETFRLHPPVPLLIPHKAMEDAKVCGYTIPKNTKLIVNVWAMCRDPSVWTDPLTYNPERLMDSSVDYKGLHFELIPFGAGRRMCVGMPLAHKMVHYTIAALLHSFDWSFDGGIEKLDMGDNFGVSLHKKIPLHVVAKPRLHPSLY